MGLPSTVASAGSEKSGTANQMWMELKYEPTEQKITATFNVEETMPCLSKAEDATHLMVRFTRDAQILESCISAEANKYSY